MDDVLIFFKGMGICFSIIMAIGAQNALVLKNGIEKSHVFLSAITCSIIDMVLIILGTNGLGSVINKNLYLLNIAKYGGAAFLFYYGYKSFYSALYTTHSIANADTIHIKKSVKATFVALLAMSLLNPHVYLDTVVLLGSIGAQFPDDVRIYFTAGAIFASFIWFFLLAYGAGYLAPLFKNPKAWKCLDAFVGILMWSIAASLIF